MLKWLKRDAAIRVVSKLAQRERIPGVIEFDLPAGTQNWIWGNRIVNYDMSREYLRTKLDSQRVIFVSDDQHLQVAAAHFVDSLASILDIACGKSEVDVAVLMGDSCKHVWWDSMNCWGALWKDGTTTRFGTLLVQNRMYDKISLGLIHDSALVELIRDSCNCQIQQKAIDTAYARKIVPPKEHLSFINDMVESKFGITTHPAPWSLVWHDYVGIYD